MELPFTKWVCQMVKCHEKCVERELNRFFAGAPNFFQSIAPVLLYFEVEMFFFSFSI